MSKDYFSDFPLAKEIWEKKYKDVEDDTIKDTWSRVSNAVASVEDDKGQIAIEFYSILEDFLFIPGGRITNGAGTKNNYLLNCATIPLKDSLSGIYDSLKRTAILAKCNYGTGFNPSVLRPKDAALSNGGTSSGVVSFLKVFDASAEVIKTGGSTRRSANISIVRCDHPEIFEYIDAKREEGVLTNFNISVGITNHFIKCVKEDLDFDLVFKGKVYKTIKARELWDKICYSGWMYNDPGIINLDELQYWNPLFYKEVLDSVNP